MEGITPSSFDSLLGLMHSDKIIENVGEVSSDEVSHVVSSGKKTKK